jgi:amino acid permease
VKLGSMNATALKALAALVPTCLLLVGSAVLFSRARTVSTFLQLVGAGCLTVVVLTHVCEAFDLAPWMQWGLSNSAGHYLDLVSAFLGLVLFPIGYLWHAITKRES